MRGLLVGKPVRKSYRWFRYRPSRLSRVVASEFIEGLPIYRQSRRNRMAKARRASNVGTRAMVALLSPKRLVSSEYAEDMRQYHPEGKFRPLWMTNGYKAHVDEKLAVMPKVQPKKKEKVSYKLAFVTPAKVIRCVRRKTRKEVMHAFQIAGSNPNLFKKPKRNIYSNIEC